MAAKTPGMHKELGHQTAPSVQRDGCTCFGLVPTRTAKIRIGAADLLPPSLFAPLGRSSSPSPSPPSDDALPWVSECAVHLQLLEAYAAVKEKCMKSQKLARSLSLSKPLALSFPNRKRCQDLQRAKWDTYLALAVVRFKKWWDVLPEILLETGEDPAKPRLTAKTLPPLDVLMVWQTQLISPDDYKTLCHDTIKQCDVYAMEFPWDLAHDAIDPFDSSFRLSAEAEEYFQQKTSLPTDLYVHLAEPKEYDRISRAFLQRVALAQLPKAKHFNPKDLDAHPRDYTPLIREYSMWQYSIKELKPVVQRQESFWEEMGTAGWLRGPSPAFTLGRILSQYNKFLQLHKLHPEAEVLIPTSHVALCWRTHQCSPARYAEATQDICGRFLTVDENAAKYAAMAKGFDKTANLYKQEFKEDYNPCLCWSCEAELSEKKLAAGDLDDDEVARRAEEKVSKAVEMEIARKKGKLTRIQ